MKALQYFFIEGRPLGTAEREVNVHCRSYIFVCEVCGEVYAKAPLTQPNQPPLPWEALTGRCAKESPKKLYSDIPGSIMIKHWDFAFIDALPMPVLQWELERHILAYERIHDEDST